MLTAILVSQSQDRICAASSDCLVPQTDTTVTLCMGTALSLSFVQSDQYECQATSSMALVPAATAPRQKAATQQKAATEKAPSPGAIVAYKSRNSHRKYV